MTRFNVALPIIAASVLAGCVTIAKPVVHGGSCVPVTCPVGTVDIELWPRAARVDGNNVTLLMSRDHYPSPSSVVVGDGDEFIRVNGFGQVQGQIAAAAPISDGFIVVMSPDSSDIYNRDLPDMKSLEPISMEVSHVVGARVEWTQPLVTSAETRAPDDGLALAATTDEFALAYLVDKNDRWNNAFTVERRSIASGELIERTIYSPATEHAKLDLAYTERGLVFVWSPPSYRSDTPMFMAVVGEPAEPLPRSSKYGSVTLLSNGAIVVERFGLLSGRVDMDGRSFAKLSGRRVLAESLAVIESEVGTAVAFFGSEWAKRDRTGFVMIIGDSGVGLRLESEPQPYPSHTLRIDRARLLHVVELQDHVELSILGCAGSSAVDGFACETPEPLTL